MIDLAAGLAQRLQLAVARNERADWRLFGRIDTGRVFLSGHSMGGGAVLGIVSDFDQADQAIRAGAPEKAAWGIALGLTVTLVWLYLEILRLLSYFNNN